MIKMIKVCGKNLAQLEEEFKPKTTLFVRDLVNVENLSTQYVSEYYFDTDTHLLWVRMLGDEMTDFEICCEETDCDYVTILDEEPAYINYINGTNIPFFEVVETTSISEKSYMEIAEELMDLFKEGIITYENMMKVLLDITAEEYNKTCKEDDKVCVVPKYDINLDFDEEELHYLEELTN